MIDGNVNDFLDHSTYEEVAVRYKGRKYFFYGLIFDRDEKIYTFNVDIYVNHYHWEETVCEISDPDKEECMRKFFALPCFEGKTFWEAESEMEWVEC